MNQNSPPVPSLEQRFAESMGALLGPDFPDHIALAVSGGGDSMAMLHLAHNWARVWGPKLWVVTIDHGLRTEAVAEAAMVAEECAILGRPHATLRWHWDGQGNLQERAREARLALIDRWRSGIDHVLFAHTQDDLAETFLMRLKRGSGVEGLAAMAASRRVAPHRTMAKQALAEADVDQNTPPPMPRKPLAGARAFSSTFQQLRPCLEMQRRELRHMVTVLKIPFVDDPSNDDLRFERVKIRREIDALDLDVARLADTAQAMAGARAALEARAFGVAETITHQQHGDILFDRAGFETTERDTQERLLAGALCAVSSSAVRPRRKALSAALDTALSGGQSTLHGCVLRCERDQFRVFREFNALKDMAVDIGPSASKASERFWDGRWRADPRVQASTLRALGEDGARQLPRRPEAMPFAALIAKPALFEGATLIACPAADFGPVGVISENYSGVRFPLSLLSH